MGAPKKSPTEGNWVKVAGLAAAFAVLGTALGSYSQYVSLGNKVEVIDKTLTEHTKIADAKHEKRDAEVNQLKDAEAKDIKDVQASISSLKTEHGARISVVEDHIKGMEDILHRIEGKLDDLGKRR